MNPKTWIAMVSIVLGAVALVGAGGAGGARSATYDVTVDTIEGCSCPLFCTCYFGASADEHMCQANNVYKFRKGSHWGVVDLSDSIVWLNADLGGEWHKNPGPGMEMAWALVTFDHVAGRCEGLARENGERTRGDQPRQDFHAPPRPERAGRDPEPPVLELDVERRIQPRLLDAPLQRRGRRPQVLLGEAQRLHDHVDGQG
jgi:hypothetical protein